MVLWADWVRASLYLTDFLRDIDWEARETPDGESLTLIYRRHDYAATEPSPAASEIERFYRVWRPDIASFEKQLKFLRAYQDQRTDRAAEIVTQLGFPTPYFAMILGLQGVPNRFTFELIAVAQVLAAHVAMIVKHHLACRRPDRIGAKVMPMIPTPAHGSFPSAHATEAFVVAEVLKALIGRVEHYPDVDKRKKLLDKLAERIAVNRTVAGLHYPIDTWAGAILGRTLGQLIVARCGIPTQVDAYSYRARSDLDFFIDEFAKGENAAFGVSRMTSFSAPRSSLFEWLWGKALKEFDLER
jgi:membrane-associated phospholipid phosphatase